MATVFFSHSRQDGTPAASLKKWLEDREIATTPLADELLSDDMESPVAPERPLARAIDASAAVYQNTMFKPTQLPKYMKIAISWTENGCFIATIARKRCVNR